jgi:hypothetical protein
MIDLLINIIAVGVLLWAINTFIPVEARVKQILNGVVILMLILSLLKYFGVWQHLSRHF